jgi:hypothetical protein
MFIFRAMSGGGGVSRESGTALTSLSPCTLILVLARKRQVKLNMDVADHLQGQSPTLAVRIFSLTNFV